MYSRIFQTNIISSDTTMVNFPSTTTDIQKSMRQIICSKRARPMNEQRSSSWLLLLRLFFLLVELDLVLPRQERIEAKDKLGVPVEQDLHAAHHAIRINPARKTPPKPRFLFNLMIHCKLVTAHTDRLLKAILLVHITDLALLNSRKISRNSSYFSRWSRKMSFTARTYGSASLTVRFSAGVGAAGAGGVPVGCGWTGLHPRRSKWNTNRVQN